MKWIGLTGGLGSGKSTAALRLRELGYPVADADQLAKQALEQSLALQQELVQRYGPKILTAAGALDRKALGKIVFNSKADLLWLESQIHPIVKAEVQKLKKAWAADGHGLAFYDVPLLFEKKMEEDFDAIVLVHAPKRLIFRRVAQRDRLDDTSIHERMSNQIPLDKKRELSHHILENDRDLPHLYAQLDQLLGVLKGTPA